MESFGNLPMVTQLALIETELEPSKVTEHQSLPIRPPAEKTVS
jgi:hypothetical protein